MNNEQEDIIHFDFSKILKDADAPNLSFSIDKNKMPEANKSLFKKGRRLVFWDTETTGLVFGEDKIIEIAFLEISEGKLTRSFRTLINPLKHIDEGSRKVHGISDYQVKNEKPFKEYVDIIKSFIRGEEGQEPAILIAYNSKFDEGMLNGEFANLPNNNQPPLTVESMSLRRFDLMDISKGFFPSGGKHSLDAFMKNLNMNNDLEYRESKGHNALLDTACLAKAFLLAVQHYDLSLLRKYENNNVSFFPRNDDFQQSDLSIEVLENGLNIFENAVRNKKILKLNGVEPSPSLIGSKELGEQHNKTQYLLDKYSNKKKEESKEHREFTPSF